MIKTGKIITFLLLTLILILATACGRPTTSNADERSTELFISAASSMTDSILSLAAVYEKDNPTVKLTINFGGSGSLMRQIEQGSPVDVFISASTDKMDTLDEQSLILEGTRSNLLMNELVLICPKESSSIEGFNDLNASSVEHFAIGEPNSVPAGKYAKEALSTMGLYLELSDKLIFAKNVREVLTWVETGNAEAGLVYETDALTSDKITIVAPADTSTYSPIIYPIAIIKASEQAEAAKDFIAFLYSQQGKDTFKLYGFHMAE